MKNRFVYIVIILFSSGFITAQEPVMSSFMDDPAQYGASFSGSDFTKNIALDISTMWTGIEDGLQHGNMRAQMRSKDDVFGYGLAIAYTNFGLRTEKNISLAAAYKLPVSFAHIYAGVQAGVQDLSVIYSAGNFIQAGDPLQSADLHTQVYVAGCSVHWEDAKGYFGISVPGIYLHASDPEYADPQTPVHMQGGYKVTINADWDITPAFIYTLHPDMPGQLAVQLRGTWKQTVSMDAGYRTNTFYMLGLGYTHSLSFTIAYHYFITTGALGQVAGGSHGLFIGYTFPEKKDKNAAS